MYKVDIFDDQLDRALYRSPDDLHVPHRDREWYNLALIDGERSVKADSSHVEWSIRSGGKTTLVRSGQTFVSHYDSIEGIDIAAHAMDALGLQEAFWSWKLEAAQG
jgi:hypothetical protein